MSGIDFFDVDHTITRHSSGRRFAISGIRAGILPISALFSIPYYYFWYRILGKGTGLLKKEIPCLKGQTKKYLEQISLESFNNKLKYDIYSGAISIIQELKNKGRKLVLATSSIDIIIKPLADYLGVSDIIASSFEFNDGICTGRFNNEIVFGKEKKRLALDYINCSNSTPEECSFYSDSVHDIPLLKAVGRPVAVNPDRFLKRIAVKREWEIMKFSE